MKKLFSLIALLMIVLTEAWSNTVTFTPTDFSGSGTKTITATDATSGITLTIVQSSSDIQLMSSFFNFGVNGDITVTATTSAGGTRINGITMNGDNNTAIETRTENSPWIFTVSSGGLSPDGKTVYSITIDYMKGQAVQPMVPVTPHDALAALMGETVYVNTEGASIYVNKDGLLEADWGSPEPSVFSPLFTFSFDQESGNFVATSEIPYRYTFYVKDGKVTKIVEEGPGGQVEFLPENSVETTIAALMGKTVYVNTEGASIYVNKEGLLVDDWGSLSSRYTFSFDQESGNFVATSEMPYRYIFYVKNGKVTKIVEKGPEDLFEYLPSFANIEEQIAWLMGNVKYTYSNDNDEYKIYVGIDGHITFSSKNFSQQMAEDFNFVADGDDFVTESKASKNMSYRFVVENYMVTKIVRENKGEKNEYLPKKSAEEQIAALMGTVQYVYKFSSIYVNSNGKIVLRTFMGTILLSEDYNFMADGNDFVTDENEGTSYRFVVENGKVTKIVDTSSADVVFLPEKSVEEEIAELMGETKYVFTIGNDEQSIYVDSDGKLICYRGKMNELFTFSIDQISGNYVAECKTEPWTFTFYVEEGKVTKIVERDPGVTVEYLPKQGTATAIKQAKKAEKKADKAVKTVENGKIVIIKNGNKYNLNGQKL